MQQKQEARGTLQHSKQSEAPTQFVSPIFSPPSLPPPFRHHHFGGGGGGTSGSNNIAKTISSHYCKRCPLDLFLPSGLPSSPPPFNSRPSFSVRRRRRTQPWMERKVHPKIRAGSRFLREKECAQGSIFPLRIPHVWGLCYTLCIGT